MHAMTSNLTELEIDSLKHLREIGCCLICSLRFCEINFSDHNFFFKSFLSKVLLLHNPLQYTDLCTICLGILQIPVIKSFTKKIKNTSKDMNYDCNTVYFAINIPTSVYIREHSVYVYLLDELRKSNSQYDVKLNIQSLKNILKCLLFFEVGYILNKHIELASPSSPLMLDILYYYYHDQDECLKLFKKFHFVEKKSFKLNRQQTVTKKIIDKIMSSIGNEDFHRYFPVPPKLSTHSVMIHQLEFRHNSIFVGGRYIKLSRRLSQTPWYVRGICKMSTSVQELICAPLVNYTKAESIKFLSSGREDVDVRMLALGRPFAIELINPKITKITQDELRRLYEEINENTDKIKITNTLKIISKSNLKILKQGETFKFKSYRALCLCKKTDKTFFLLEKLHNMKNIKIIQYTPVRVLHRRTLSPRERIIYEIRTRFPNSNELNNYCQLMKQFLNNHVFIILDLKTQAGTYIKEFVHGDFGRTFPNLCYLLQTEIDLISLDVTDVSVKWP